MDPITCIREGYTIRPQPDYFHDTVETAIYQPDVYVDAGRVARRLGATKIVDIGCGTAQKLIEMRPEFETIGLDYGPNIERCRAGDPGSSADTWRATDLDIDEALPLAAEDLEASVVICSDVIEHVKRPEFLLEKLLGTLEHASALFLSTPERVLEYDENQMGPPPNPAHVREWTVRELSAMCRRAGFAHLSPGTTRANNREVSHATILLGFAPTAEALADVEEALIDRPRLMNDGTFWTSLRS
jgi:SAM-dependent methyltransferase